MAYKNSKAFCLEQENEVKALIKISNHVYISGRYETKKSSLFVHCQIHNKTTKTTFDNYKRCRTGLRCCGRQSASDKLKNRMFSEETIQQMSLSAKQRERKGGDGQDWRRTKDYSVWHSSVSSSWNSKCAITNKTDNLACHHFFSGRRGTTLDFRQLLMYEPLNGIVLSKEVHGDFHKRYGYERNTLKQFQEYTRSVYDLLISSQAQQQCFEGSETRVYDPLFQEANSKERIMKLQERLEEIKKGLEIKYQIQLDLL